MNEAHFKSISYWEDTTEFKTHPTLKENVNTEVLVVGAGMAGLLSAYKFAKAGKKVTVIDMKRVAKGATANTTARITAQQGAKYAQLIDSIGQDKAKEYYDSQIEAIDAFERIIDAHNIDCDFERVTSKLYAESEDGLKTLENEYESYQKLGIEGQLSSSDELPFNVTGMLSMPRQAQFHPLKFLNGIINIFLDQDDFDVSIYENTRAKDIKENTLITEDGYEVHFHHVCITTHFPFLDYKGFYFNSFKVDKSYAYVAETEDALPDATSYSGSDEPGLSLRSVKGIENHSPLVLFGGFGHLSSELKESEDEVRKLKLAASVRFDIKEPLYAFQAQDMITTDSVPYIGYFDGSYDNRFVASGFNKYGMTNSMVAANVFLELAETGDSKYKELFAPNRHKGILERVKSQLTTPFESLKAETLNLATNVENFKDVELKPGEGQLVRDGSEVRGLFKDKDNDMIYSVGSRCTHMGCTVQWNNLDKSWDCPCHGSRFNYDGKIIEGPALEPLDCKIINEDK